MAAIRPIDLPCLQFLFRARFVSLTPKDIKLIHHNEVDTHALQSFPPCMLQRHLQLREHHRLPHTARVGCSHVLNACFAYQKYTGLHLFWRAVGALIRFLTDVYLLLSINHSLKPFKQTHTVFDEYTKCVLKLF